jgi:hypothetical protein
MTAEDGSSGVSPPWNISTNFAISISYGSTATLPATVSQSLIAPGDRTVHLSRSGVFATAARDYLERARRRCEVEAYVASYGAAPETDEEIAITDAFLTRSLDS